MINFQPAHAKKDFKTKEKSEQFFWEEILVHKDIVFSLIFFCNKIQRDSLRVRCCLSTDSVDRPTANQVYSTLLKFEISAHFITAKKKKEKIIPNQN